MHGRPRKPAKPEDESASAARAEALRALQSQFFSNHHNKVYTDEALQLSGRLIEQNPEFYTAWNYRKLVVRQNLDRCSESEPDALKSIIDQELRLVEIALRQNFKSYGAWHHRKWVLSKGHSVLDREMKLLKQFQQLDPRNFHAWNYRRSVAALLNRSDEEELEYTREMVENNFSNYSAWHNRRYSTMGFGFSFEHSDTLLSTKSLDWIENIVKHVVYFPCAILGIVNATCFIG